MAPQYKLIYFDGRGVAEPIRFIFAYAGIPFEDERHKGLEEWGKVKGNYTWATLPKLIVDGTVLDQSGAILRYLGKLYKVAGDNEFEAAKCDEMVEALADLKKVVFGALFEEDAAKKVEQIAAAKYETLPKFLGQFDKIIKANGGFLVGNRLSYADFAVAATLDLFKDNLDANLLDKYPALKAHNETVFAAKGIKEWVAKRPKTDF